MRKSHRKDVIIARIIFAVMVLALIVLIIFGIRAIAKYRRASANRQQQEQTETVATSESQTDSEQGASVPDENEQWVISETETGETETEEETETEDADGTGEEQTDEPEQTVLESMFSVNIRSGAGVDNPVVGGVAVGETVILLEEREDGWGYIQRGDLTGYVYLEYFRIVDDTEE
jgi:cytoskeletal protein RodZ